MAKGKKLPHYVPHAINPAAPQENFAEYYSFDTKNKVSPRERLVGVDKWDKKYGCCDDYAPKAGAFKRGEPSKFRQTKPAGKLRVSGMAGAHRIGKR